MKIRNRILAGLLSFTVVMGELLPVYAAGDGDAHEEEPVSVEIAAEEAEEDTEEAEEAPAAEEDADENDTVTAEADAADFTFAAGYIDLEDDTEATILNTDKTYQELRSELVFGETEEDYSYSPEADRASALDAAFPYSYRNTDAIRTYFTNNFPEVRNQNPFGSCWAHSAMSLGEFYLATHGKLSDRTAVDFSELHMAYYCYTQGTPSVAGDTGDKVIVSGNLNEKLDSGGNLKFAAQTLAQGRGFVDESVAPYPEYDDNKRNINDYVLTIPDPSTERMDSAYLTSAYVISMENPDKVKQALISNGIVGVSIYWGDAYYNSAYNSYVCKTMTSTNHAVAIVGWDDDFPASRFASSVNEDGAWLVRNSWNYSGSDLLSKNCYFWLSYEDTSLSDNAWVFEADTEGYDNHYFYDSQAHGEYAGFYEYSANVYQAKANADGSEILEAVGFHVLDLDPEGTGYEVSVYTGLTDGTPSSGTLEEASVTRGTLYFDGYYTVKLKEAVSLDEGEYYAVVLKRDDGKGATCEVNSTMGSFFRTESGALAGQSFASANGSSWSDYGRYSRGNYIIGAYTTNVDDSDDKSSLSISPVTMTLEVDGEGTIDAVAKDRDGNIDNSSNVSFVSSNPSVATVTVSGRRAAIKAVKSGSARITAKYGKRTAVCQVTVREKEQQIPAAIVLNKTALSFTAADQSEKLTATVTDTNNRVITDPQLNFESRDSGVATVDEDGNVRPVATGATSIIVNCGSAYASCSVAVALPGMKTAAPVADLADGSEIPAFGVILLSCTTPGAKIYYTTDGSIPTEESTLYGKDIPVPESAIGSVFTVKAVAVAEGYAASDVAAFHYTVTEPDNPLKQTEAPTADPVSGETLAVGDTIRLSCATPGAKIYYTTDETMPTESSTLYEKAIVVPESASGSSFVIIAMAVAEGYTNSGAGSFSYFVELLNPGDKTAAPIADPESGSKVAVGDTIQLSCAMSKAKIYYTTDGSDPDESSLLYKDKIVVPESAPGTVFTVKAMTVAEGYAASSVEEFVYTVVEDVPLAQTAAPTADPASGTKLSVGDTISLSCETEGAKIFYTIDGTEAGEASALYGKPIAVTADMAGMTLTIRAIALAEGYEASEEQSFSYTVKEIPKPGPESGPSPMDPVPHVTEDQAFYLVKGQKLDVTGEGIPVIFDMSGAIALAKNGIITAKKEGKAVLRVGQGRYDIIVVEPALSQTLVKLVPGETETLYVSRSCYGAELSAQYPVYWVSSAPAVASVTPDGEIRALSKGSATITAYVNGKAYKCKVKVADTEKPALSVESREEAVTLSAVTLQPLQSYTLKLKGLSFKNRTWYSEDGKLKLKYDGKKNVYESRTVRIDEKGKITAIGSGSCVVCFMDEYDTEYRLPLNVAEPVERVLYLNSGKSRKLKFYGVKNSTAVFRSEDQHVAKVDSKGTVKAFKAGETTVSCTYGNFTFITHVYTEYAALETGDRLYQDGDQYHYQLRIRKGSEPYSLRFRMGDDYYGVYQSVLFTSNKNEIAFVDENGRVEARKSGNALITAKVNGKKITIKVTVTP